jgi:hypothetical protein
MAYDTAHIDNVVKTKDGLVAISVTFSGADVTPVQKIQIVPPQITPEQLRQSILNDLNNLTASDTFSKVLQPGDVDLTPPVIIPSAKDVWFANFARLKGMEEAINRGWMTETDKPDTDLLTVLTADFLQEYASDLRMRIM